MTNFATPKAPRLHIEVTREIMEDSKKRDSSHCMIAEAIKAAKPDAQHVAVDVQTIRFSDPKTGFRYIYLTPRIAQTAIIRFDQGVDPEPFCFWTRNGQVVRMGNARKRADVATPENDNPNLKKARLVKRHSTAGLIPDVVGGRAPPRVPKGNRREFGLRAFTA